MILTDKDTLCNRYIRKKIQKYKNKKAIVLNENKQIKGVTIRKWIHPILITVLHIKSFLSGMTYEIVSKTEKIPKDKTVIYAITHIGKSDYEMVTEACDIFAYVFAGDWETMYATVGDYFFRANGVIYVDTSDKEDRSNSFKYMVTALKQGISVMIFPEGIWNLTENLPMMKIYPGAVQASKLCSVPIVPIAIEQVDQHFLINIGKEFSVDDIEEKEAVQLLRDTLASLKWEIWESLPRKKRADIPDDYYEKFLKVRLDEYPAFDMKVINGRMYKDKKDREYLEVKGSLESLENLEK